MAIDRNITININDTSPLANTAYVDVGKENKVYNKAQVNELVEDLREGTLGSVSPSQTLQQLNALPDGNYYASEAGTYAFGTNVPVGWQYRFNKTGTTWKVLTKVQIPMQDLTALENRTTALENKNGGEVVIGNDKNVTGGEVYESALIFGKDTSKEIGNNKANVDDDDKFIPGYYVNNANGNRKANANSSVLIIDNIKPNKIYTISGRSSSSGARAALVYFNSLNEKSKPLNKLGVESADYSTYGSGNATFLTRNDTTRIEMVLSFTSGVDAFKDTIMVNEGESALPYEPYSENYKINPELIPNLDYATIDEVKELIKPINIFELQINNELSRVRLPYSDSEDLLWRMTTNNNENKCYCFVSKSLISKNDEITENGTLIGNVGSDEIAPVLINDMYIGANHGSTALRIVTATSHGKTNSDVGSKWIGSNSKKYFILKIIDENTLWMCSEDEGNWTFVSVPNGIFTHESKGTNTADFIVNSSVTSQLRPVVRHISKHYLADGNKVIENRTYKAHDLKFIEEYDIIDTTSMLERLYDNAPNSIEKQDFLNGEVIATVKNIYNFTKGGAIINNELIIKKSCYFNSYGVTQNGYYAPSWVNSFMKYIPYVKINGVYDFRKPTDFKPISVNSSFSYTSEFWQDENTPPRRYSDRSIGTSRDIIFNLGYLPIGAGYNRKNYVNNSLWINTTKKTYPNVVTGDKVDADNGNVVYSSSAYRIHSPKDSEVYNKVVLEQDNQLFISLDFDSVGFKRFKVADKWIGKKIEIIATTPNIKVLSNIVSGYIEFNVLSVSDSLASVDFKIK